MSIIVTPEQRTDLRRKLNEHFGFRRFRAGQEEAVAAAIQGKDTLVVMPTGSGKSLCYQLPALELDGTTVVVSPLLALMKDQADALAKRGYPVAEVNSTLNERQERLAAEAIEVGLPEFVFTTPERLSDPEFRDVLKRRKLDLIVVDEAHCISQWGHDFRPDYLDLGLAIDDLGHPPVLAMTATATAEVIDDILAALRLDDAEVVHTGFYRPNIDLAVIGAEGDEAKRNALLHWLKDAEGTGIIYCATVKAVEELSRFLEGLGLPVAAVPRPDVEPEAGRGTGPVHEGRGPGDGGDQRLRPRDRQAGHPVRGPLPDPGDDRVLLPGVRPGRPRRRAGVAPCCSTTRPTAACSRSSAASSPTPTT